MPIGSSRGDALLERVALDHARDGHAAGELAARPRSASRRTTPSCGAPRCARCRARGRPARCTSRGCASTSSRESCGRSLLRPDGIADHRGRVADDQHDRVPELLQGAQLQELHGVPDVQVRRARVHAELDAQRRFGARSPRRCASSRSSIRSTTPRRKSSSVARWLDGLAHRVAPGGQRRTGSSAAARARRPSRLALRSCARRASGASALAVAAELARCPRASAAPARARSSVAARLRPATRGGQRGRAPRPRALAGAMRTARSSSAAQRDARPRVDVARELARARPARCGR